MSERDVQEQLNRLRAEIESIIERYDRGQREMRAEVDSLKIEMQTVHRFLAKFHPEFTAAYPALRENVVRGLDPEFAPTPKQGSL